MDVNVGNIVEISSSFSDSGPEAGRLGCDGRGFAGEGRPRCGRSGDSKGGEICPVWWHDTLEACVENITDISPYPEIKLHAWPHPRALINAWSDDHGTGQRFRRFRSLGHDERESNRAGCDSQ